MCTYSICRVQKGGRKCRENGWGQPCPPNTNIYIFRKLYYNGNTSYRINTDVNRAMPQDFLVWNVWIIQSHVAFIITRPNHFANFFKFADIFALFVDTAVDSNDSSRVLNRTALSQTIFTFFDYVIEHWLNRLEWPAYGDQLYLYLHVPVPELGLERLGWHAGRVPAISVPTCTSVPVPKLRLEQLGRPAVSVPTWACTWA